MRRGARVPGKSTADLRKQPKPLPKMGDLRSIQEPQKHEALGAKRRFRQQPSAKTARPLRRRAVLTYYESKG
jgi:hypothetical protein